MSNESESVARCLNSLLNYSIKTAAAIDDFGTSDAERHPVSAFPASSAHRVEF
jgi:hypothetical protein